MNLKTILQKEVERHELASRLSETQMDNIVKGLELYINDYLAEQIPEQIENELDVTIIHEYCSNCEGEVIITSERKYQTCPECKEPIAPCSAYYHGENGVYDCVCHEPLPEGFNNE